MIKRIILSLGAALLAAATGAGAPLRVATLSTVLTEIAARVGGPEAQVSGLLPPGVDPHTFEPAPADLRVIAGADLVLASGLGVETYLGKLVANSGTRAQLAEAGAALDGRLLYAEAHGRREPDPHWWNSVPSVMAVTRLVARRMAALRPEAAAGFEARAAAYVAQLAALDAWAREEIASIPPSRRQLVTNHDAFGWFARDYGLTVHPISGLSSEAEPNARDLARLIELIRQERIPAIFIESSENSKLAVTLARETGARVGGTLFADGLVPEADGATYPELVRHNVRTIVAALR